MEQLVIKRVETAECDFDCGVESVNKFVSESQYPSLTRQAYIYSISAKNRVLGYYQILLRTIELSEFPDDVESDSGVTEGKIAAIHIRFIAIKKEVQKNKIGTAAINIIVEQVDRLSKQWPFRVITIDAFPHLEKWYLSQGFKRMKTPPAGSINVPMYYDCISQDDDLYDYENMMIEDFS